MTNAVETHQDTHNTVRKFRGAVRKPVITKTKAGNRSFVAFRGFDGQSLAGTGALVWEGEILHTHH